MRNGATTSISLPPTFKIKSREVIPASPADVGTLSQVIADAFHDLPPSPWLISDPVTRRRIFPAYFRLYVEHAMANGPPARRAGDRRRWFSPTRRSRVRTGRGRRLL
jgi:hypothetical protein